LDGYMGVIVSAFIMYSGIKVLKETINNIMGRAPSKELINKIESFIQGYEGVMGIHDLVVHDYGPQHCFASLHVEVDANADILESHDLIDNIERDMLIDHGIHLVIHLDPIVTDDPFVKEMKDLTKKIVSEIDRSLSIHDFRIVKGKAHKNLIFDVLMTEQCKLNEKTIQDEIIKRIKEIDMELYAVITIDRSFVSTPSKKLIK
ncbi:MAG: cation-efflux pump, partial [Clostridiaceae bacterium]|nr:cation-efflux pump [Clostridiaceae bacterium]